MNKEDIKTVIPGFGMGIIRAIISHPFEMMKIKAQINENNNFYKNLFKGIHYSIITNAIERGVQFALFEKFKKDRQSNFMSSVKSSMISTAITFPYSVILLKKVILNSPLILPQNVMYKSIGLEYCRNLSGSILFLSSYNYMKDKDIPILFRAPLSGCFVWSLTYPIDSYKNILISNNTDKINIKRLYKGIQYPMCRSIPSSIVGFYVYEYLLNYINIYN